MLLPDKYNGWSRTRATGSFAKREIVTKRTTITGTWPNTVTKTPFIEGWAHITVDPRNTGWVWSRRLLRSDPKKYAYLRKFDFGGAFISNRIEYFPPYPHEYKSTQKVSGGPLLLHEQSGSPFPCFNMWQKFQNPLDTRSMPIGTSFYDLWALGGSYIAQTMPTVPVMNLSVSVAELLREGLPRKLGSSLRKKISLKTASDEYLNVMFGYVPLLSDISTLAKALPRLEEAMKQLVRDNGRLVRRGVAPRTVTLDESYTHNAAIYGSGSAVPGHNSVRPCRHTITREVTTWFSAAYTYNLPSLDEVTDRFAQIRTVLGLNIDAQSIWNLIPWSWLVGWLMPVEPILQNLSVMARNQVRIQRAYIMCHTRYTETAANGPYRATLGMTSKQRDHASPWGFGVKAENLTSTQLSILAALGLSRGHI